MEVFTTQIGDRQAGLLVFDPFSIASSSAFAVS
jgi:hypothetical protein